MAILAIFTGNGVTKQMYDQLRKEVDWEHKHPTGVILHSAGFDDSGNNLRVADIWESEQDLNSYVNSRLKPVMERLNIPMPKGEIYPVHNVNAYAGVDMYKARITEKGNLNSNKLSDRLKAQSENKPVEKKDGKIG
jgi:hypothetical protein